MFHVGQRVVCVRDGWCDASDVVALPRAGVEYIIRSIIHEPGQSPGLRFHWMVNPPRLCRFGIYEPAFASRGHDGILNFRPVVDHKTDISIFTRMLTSKPARTPVRAQVDADLASIETKSPIADPGGGTGGVKRFPTAAPDPVIQAAHVSQPVEPNSDGSLVRSWGVQ